MSECYHNKFILNGEIKDTSLFDIDYVFRGDSLYEVFRIIDGIPLFWEDHITRLFHTSEITGRDIWHKDSEIRSFVDELIRINEVEEGTIKLVFNYQKKETNPEKNFLVYFVEPLYPSPSQYQKGVHGILFQASRVNPTAKVINQNLRIAVYKQLIEKGAYEALLVNNEGLITEGSRSNIFIIKDGMVFTAPDTIVLPGIARKKVIDTCRLENIPLTYKNIHINEMKMMDAIFMTGTSTRVLPFSLIEDYKFNTDDPVLAKITNGYNKVIWNYIRDKKV